jgi:hypothetical protein
MNKKTAGLLVVLFMAFGIARGQNVSVSANLIRQIDSLSKARNVRTGKAIMHYVTYFGEKTDTEQRSLTKLGSFKFEGEFIVINDVYFNLNKLLYFSIQHNYFVFFFQGY